jgi:outer membrane receptor for monomeric catechols
MEGQTSGGTFWLNWKPTTNWRLRFQYAYLNMEMESKPESVDLSALGIVGESPENQYALYSFLDLPWNLSLYVAARYVDELPSQLVESYTATDINLIWKSSSGFETSLTIQNLLEGDHLEYGEGGRNYIGRSIYGRIAYRF